MASIGIVLLFVAWRNSDGIELMLSPAAAGLCRWVAEEDHIVNFPTVRLKRGMPIKVTSKD
jgi:hypothetical protein